MLVWADRNFYLIYIEGLDRFPRGWRGRRRCRGAQEYTPSEPEFRYSEREGMLVSASRQTARDVVLRQWARAGAIRSEARLDVTHPLSDC